MTKFIKIKVSFRSKLANKKKLRHCSSLWRKRVVQSKTLFENRRIPSVDRETASNALEKVKEICAKSNLEIPDSNLDRVHRISKPYFDKIKKVKCKSIIVCFNTFYHQELLHRTIKGYKTEERVQCQIRFNKIIKIALFNTFWIK